MAKDPAVLFYYQDFLVGTSFLTEASVGAYIRILCHLYDKDSLSEQHLLSVCSSSDIWNSIKDKFEQDPDGSYYHQRARLEKEKRVRFTESRRINASKASSTKEHTLCISEASAKRMEDEDEDDNKDVINHEVGIENKKSPEGIMKRIWNRQCENTYEQQLLQRNWIECGKDPEVFEHAFRASVEQDVKTFAYVKGVIAGSKKDADLKAAKKREHEASLRKIQDHKEFKPDPEAAKVFGDIVKSMQPGRKKKPDEPELSTEEKLNRSRSQSEFDRAVKEGDDGHS